jgi:hypothetical protein
MNHDDDTLDYIDIFYFPDVDPAIPYRCFVWQSGSIVEKNEYANLEEMVAWCKRQGLTVRVYDERVRQEICSYGLVVKPPIAREREVGRSDLPV